MVVKCYFNGMFFNIVFGYSNIFMKNWNDYKMYVYFLFSDFIRFICNFIVINIIEKYFLVRFIVVDVDNYGKL